MIEKLIIRRPDDWHLHFRDDEIMKAVVPFTASQFARAIVMPNLTPPITTTARARAYRDRIKQAVPKGLSFEPLMTCYLTDNTDVDDLIEGYQEGVFVAAKLYPSGATTNSNNGVTNVRGIDPVLARMEAEGLILCVHGEVTDIHVDIFDREAKFIEQHLARINHTFPDLKIVFEHITTSHAVDFVNSAGANVGATITPHHLHINRNAMLVGGIQPHNYCLPVAKREEHRLALRRAATSGNKKFFLGTDSAPHERSAKENSCGCAGIFNAPFALESYLQVFEEENALDHFEAFASINGPTFYGLPINDEQITLERVSVMVPKEISAGEDCIVPFHAGQKLRWRIAN
jgi:dihydroorotase